MDDEKILRLSELKKKIGLSRSTIYDRMDEMSPRYDRYFPVPINLGGSAVGWRLSEVEEWINRCGQQDGFTSPKDSGKAKTSVKKLVSTKGSSKSNNTTQQAINAIALAQTITQGNAINARLQEYMNWREWTPAVGCLLIAGVAPSTNTPDIPSENGVGLDGKQLHASNHRFHEARRFLRQWAEHEGDHPERMAPQAFLQWCVEDELKSGWLNLFLDQAFSLGTQEDSTAASRLASMIAGKRPQSI
jgi:prophage regulatory protein